MISFCRSKNKLKNGVKSFDIIKQKVYNIIRSLSARSVFLFLLKKADKTSE
jgi:hypothetical protein